MIRVKYDDNCTVARSSWNNNAWLCRSCHFLGCYTWVPRLTAVNALYTHINTSTRTST